MTLIFIPTLCVGENNSYFEKTAAGQLFIEKQEDFYIKKLLESGLIIQDINTNKQHYLEKENKLKKELNQKQLTLNEALSESTYDGKKISDIRLKIYNVENELETLSKKNILKTRVALNFEQKNKINITTNLKHTKINRSFLDREKIHYDILEHLSTHSKRKRFQEDLEAFKIKRD